MNAAMDAMGALCNSGKLRIYEGTQPATPDDGIGAGTLLAELTMNATAFGAAKNIQGATVRWVLQEWVTDTTPLLDKGVGTGIALTTPASGILTVALTPADTLALEGDYWELEIVDAAPAANVSTVAVGQLTINPSAA